MYVYCQEKDKNNTACETFFANKFHPFILFICCLSGLCVLEGFDARGFFSSSFNARFFFFIRFLCSEQLLWALSL